MQVTEYERHQLFAWFEEHMGPERAATMMNLTPPIGWFELAAKDDLHELEGRLDARFDGFEARFDAKLDGLEARFDAKLDRLEVRLTSKLVTWLLASQATTIAVVGALTVLR